MYQSCMAVMANIGELRFLVINMLTGDKIMKKILIIGSLNLDMVVNVDHAPSIGETILADKIELIPGGKGANQAYAARRLGADTTMLGAVGCDTYGDMLLDNLSSVHVDTTKIIKKDGVSTGIALITVNGDGDNSIIVVSGANAMLTKEDIDNNMGLIKSSDIILLQLEIPIDTVCYAAERAKEFGKTVILDPAPAPKCFPEELYTYIDIIKPNETELSMLTGIDDVEEHLERAAAMIRRKGVKNVLVTLGEKGVYLDCEKLGVLRISSPKVRAVDTTAAGDTFTAALAVILARGEDIHKAASFANQVASIVVTKKGAQSSIPTLEEVREAFELFPIAI